MIDANLYGNIAEDRINQFMREAEAERTAQAARRNAQQGRSPHGLRYRTGALLIGMGNRLQNGIQNGTSPIPQPQPERQEIDVVVTVEPLMEETMNDENTAPEPDVVVFYSEVRQAIRQLPKLQRQAFVLYSEHRFSTSEIADILRTSTDMVIIHLRDAQNSLREKLRPESWRMVDGLEVSLQPPHMV